MKFKLDENFGRRTQRVFQAGGHDVVTVHEEGLHSIPDQSLFDLCRLEERCLVSLDMDFSNILRFPPEGARGIVVMRLPDNPTLALMEDMARLFLRTLEGRILDGRLWIVEPGRIRVHESVATEETTEQDSSA